MPEFTCPCGWEGDRSEASLSTEYGAERKICCPDCDRILDREEMEGKTDDEILDMMRERSEDDG